MAKLKKQLETKNQEVDDTKKALGCSSRPSETLFKAWKSLKKHVETCRTYVKKD